MRPTDQTLFELQKRIIDFTLIDRNHYVAGTNKHENDADHSYAVALLCWYIHDHYSIDLDISRILKYALAHDFVEIYAGDTNAFASAAERKAKVVKEQKALSQLSGELAGFPDLIASMQGYETKTDPESLFVWSVDKMQALILGDIDAWRPFSDLDISYSAFCDKNAELLAKSSPYCREIFEGLIAYCKGTYYDQPAEGVA